MVKSFSDQHGVMFGFGLKANNNTRLKVEGVSKTKIRKLVNAPITNYKISICEKRYLEAASRKMIINKTVAYWTKQCLKTQEILKTSKEDKGN